MVYYTKNLVLAGGIKPENIIDILYRGNPQVIDISSGVENSPGVKDIKKVETIVEMARSIDVDKYN